MERFDEMSAKTEIYLGIFLAFLGYFGNWMELEPVHNMFFVFAVWSYVLIIDGIIFALKGNSLAVSRTKEFLTLLPWSVFICLLLETANFRLGVWRYNYLPLTLETRWTQYLLSFSAILPGLFETAELLETAGLFRNTKSRPLHPGPGTAIYSYGAGAAMLALALLFPRFFFALISGAFIFLCEPLNRRLGLKSLAAELEGGNPGKTMRLAAAGGICGLLWTFWSHQAGAQRLFPLHSGGLYELFGTPIAYYLTFPVLAVQCYSMYSLITWLRRGSTWEQDCQDPLTFLKAPSWLSLAAISSLTLFFYLAFREIDSRSVLFLLGWL